MIFFLGMLAMKHYQGTIEQRVNVWHPQKQYPRLKRLMEGSTFVKGYRAGERPFARGLLVTTISELHQKLIVVDGIIAFKGSANPTMAGWTRKSELIEFSTDPREVWELNTDYFARYLAQKRIGTNIQNRRLHP